MTITNLPHRRAPRRLLSLALVAGLLAPTATPALAQSYPDRPIRLIVPFGPGGGTDLVARLVAEKATQILGKSVVVENRAGGGGTVGILALTQARPDGYTLAICPPICATAPSLYNPAPFDPARAFAPVSTLVDLPLVLVARKDLGVTDAQGLLAKARSTPQGLSYASPGAGSSNHLAAETLRRAAGVEMTNIPYRSGAAALTDVVSGRVDIYFDTVASALPQVRNGAVVALGVTGRARTTQLPEVPTLGEAGLPGFETSPSALLVAPAGTPAPIIERLNAVFREALADAATTRRVVDTGAEPVGSTAVNTAAYLAGETARLGQLIRENKITAD
ncbi:Bug family tripartite tricarboxylate transporter substrate binding protein [Roseomonas sp. GCM10028921]